MFLELLIILGVTYVGLYIQELLKIPLPGIIVSMGVMFLLLSTHILKVKKIEKTTDFFLANMTILFLPATVRIYSFMSLIKDDFLKIILLLIVTTVLTLVVTSKIVHYIIVLDERKGVK